MIAARHGNASPLIWFLCLGLVLFWARTMCPFVSEQIEAATAPSVTSASVTGTSLRLSFDNSLDTSSIPSATAFPVFVGTDSLTVSGVAVAETVVTLTLSESAPDPDCDSSAVTVSYEVPAQQPLLGANGASVAAFSQQQVTNQTDLPPAIESIESNTSGNRIVITFCEDLREIDWWSSIDAFAINASKSRPVINDVTFGSDQVTILLQSRKGLTQGEEVTLSYDSALADDDKELRDADQGMQLVPNWTDVSVTNHSDTPPVPSSATALYEQITITFDQELDPTSVPSNGSWRFGARVIFPPSVTGVSIDSVTVTLSMSGIVSIDVATFFLNFEATGGSPPLRDREKTHSLESFSSLEVTHQTPTTAPVVSTASVNSSTLTLRFDLPLQEVANASAFGLSGVSGLSVTETAFSGTVVSLTLSAPVSPDDAISLSYTKPSKPPKLVGRNSKDAETFSNQAVVNDTPVPVPMLTSASIDAAGTNLTLGFSDPLLESEAGTPAADTFQLMGTSAAITNVSVSGSNANLSLSPLADVGEVITLAYTPATEPSAGRLSSADGQYHVAAWSDYAVTNGADGVPRLTDATVVDESLTLTFDRPLESTEIPASTAFALTGTDATVVKLAISGSAVTLTLSESVAQGATLSLSYTAPTSKPLRRAGNTQLVADISSFPVTNQTVSAPAPTSLSVNGDVLTITFDADLDSSSSVTTDAFNVTTDGSDWSLSQLTIGARTVTLDLATAVSDGSAVSLSFAPAADAPLNGQNGLAVEAFTDATVLNETDDAPILTSVIAAGDGSQIRLGFSEALSDAASPTPAATSFTLSGTTALISGVTVSGNEVVLTVAPVLHEMDAALISYAQPADQTAARLRDADQGMLAVADWSAETIDNQVDTAPSTLSTEVDGTAIRIEFDQDLDLSKQPDASGFSLSPANSITTVSLTNDPTTAQGVLELTLTDAVREGDAVKLTFSPSGDSQIVDPEGNAATIDNLALTNLTETPTTATGAIGNGGEIRITFDQSLNEQVVPGVASFTLSDSAIVVQQIAIAGAVVTLTIAPALTEADTLKVSYDPPDVDGLVDTTGTAVESFSLAVTNETDDAPWLTSATAQADGGALSLQFSEALDQDTDGIPSPSSFTLAGTGAVITDVGVSGAVATLTLSPSFHETDDGNLSYTPPTDSAAARLRDADQGNLEVEAWAGHAIDNQVDTAPQVLTAQIDGDRVELRFDQDLDLGSTPDASGFSLVPSRDVSSVSLSNDSATLRGVLVLKLSNGVRESESVTLSFTPSNDSAIVDPEGNSATITNLSLTNVTDSAPAPQRATVAGAEIAISFDQMLDEVVFPGISAFDVTVAGTDQRVTAVEVSGVEVTLRLSSVARRGEVVAVTYTQDPDYGLRDSSGNLTPSFSDLEAEHIGPPLPVSASADARELTISFDSALDSDAVPSTSSFVIDDAISPLTVAVSSQQVSLILEHALVEDAKVRIRYLPASSGNARLIGANALDVLGFDSDDARHRLTVTNQTDTAPVLTEAWADLGAVQLLFDQTLDLALQPSVSEFSASPSTHQVATASLANVDGQGVVDLAIAPSLVEDESISLAYAAVSASTRMADPEGNPVSISLIALDNRTDTAPVPLSGTVDGAEIELDFDQPLYLETRPIPTDHFTISGTRSTVSASTIAISNDGPSGKGKLRITLNAAAHELDAVSLHYDPFHGSVRIRDDDPGQNRAQIDHYALRNLTDTAPVLVSAAGDGETLVLTFDQPLDTNDAPVATAFSLSADAPTIDAVSIDAAMVTFSLNRSLVEDQTLTLSYLPPDVNGLRDSTGNLVSAFDANVDNLTDYAPVPVAVFSDAEGTTITVEFDQRLAPGVNPPNEVFLIDDETSVSGYTLEDNALTLTLTSSLSEGAAVELEYVQPALGGLQDDDRPNLVESFTIAVENRTDVAPVPLKAWVTSQSLAIEFDQALDEQAVPPPGCDWIKLHHPDLHSEICETGGVGEPPEWFRVKLGAESVALAKVEIDDHTVLLTLAEPPASGQTVTVVYQPIHVEGRDWKLRDTSDPANEVERIDANVLAVENRTAATPVSGEVDPADRGRIVLGFDAELAAGSPPPLAALNVYADEVELTLSSAIAESSSLTLVLTRPVPECADLKLEYRSDQAPPWTDAKGHALISFEHSVSNRIDAAAGLICLRAQAAKLILDTEAELTEATDLAKWTVSIDDEAHSVESVSVGEGSIALVLGRVPCVGEAVTVTYAGGTSWPAFSFNRAINKAAPCPISAQVNLRELVVVFDQPLATDPLSEAAAFELTHSPSVTAVTDVNGAQLSLRLSAPGAGPRDDLVLRYDGEHLRGDEGAVAPFQIAVEELGQAPRMTGAYGSGATILALFDQPLLDLGATGSHWSVSLGPDRELDVGDVIVSNSVVILELAQPLRDEDQPVLIYLAQQNNGLAGLAGHRVASSVVVPLNVTQTPPSVASASADAIVTEVEFDQRIEPDSTDASQFVVIAGRRQIEVSSLDWRASAIDLTLAEPITALDAVELRYLAHEDDSGIRDLDGKRMAPDRVVVSNLTKRPRAWSERVEDARQRARGDAATLRREILRELSSDGLHVSLAWPDEALEHEPKPTRIAGSGIVASVRLSQNPTAKSKPKPWQLQIEPLEQFAQLHEFVPRAWDIAWEGEARNRFVAAWRIDVTDQHGTPIDHEVELTLRIPRPEASGPYRALVFNLFTGNWSEAPLSLVDGAIQVRLRGPALLTIAAMELVETTMQPGLTELIFSGAEGTLLSEFATLFDESVQGAWIAGDSDTWHYFSISSPALALENGQTIWLVRPLEAATAVVSLPMAVDYVDTEQTSED